MPVKTSAVERAAIKLNAGPAPVLDYLGAMSLHAVFIADRVGVFAALAGGPEAPGPLARRLDLDERGLAALLDALEAVGYVRADGDGYALTPMAAKWMPQLSDGVGFFDWMAFDGWEGVEASLRGEPLPPDRSRPPQSHEDAEGLSGGMLSSARMSADELAARVRLPRSARRVLDVGAGHGLYSARLCRRHARLTATLVDRAAELEVARQVAEHEGVADRVELREADFLRDDLGSDYDAALLLNVLNAYDPERKVDLLRRIGRALAPGGVLVILDQMRREALRGTARAMVQLTNLRLFDPRAHDTYRLSELRGWLEEAGFGAPRDASLRSVPWMSFVVAKRVDGSAVRFPGLPPAPF